MLTIGALSSDDNGNGIENVRKTMDILSKAVALHMHFKCAFHFLSSAKQQHQRTKHGEHKHSMVNSPSV